MATTTKYHTSRITTVSRTNGASAALTAKPKAVFEIIGDDPIGVIVDALVPLWLALQMQALVDLHNNGVLRPF